MAGVEILATEKIVSETAFNWTDFWIFFGMTFCLGLLFGIIYFLTNNKGLGITISCLGIVLGVVCGFSTGSANSKPVAYKTQYKVTISDEVKMNEFYERYEVIDQEGKIYTVEERED